MEYKVVVAHSGEDLTRKVNELMKEGWSPVGGHQVHVRHIQNRFRGTQHVDSLSDLEYTQTMLKTN